MSDILVTSPYHPFTLPTQFKAVFNGYIYCGTVDAVDPSVSQVQVYLVNESGDKVPVAQPLRTNAGGFLVYNGQPAKFVTDSNHSLLVRDSLGNQLWYAPNMAEIDPAAASFLAIEALRRSYAEARYNLVDGSFETGGTLVNTTDVLLQERTGKAFSGPAGPVAAGTDPASGGFIDRSNYLGSAFSNVSDMMLSSPIEGSVVSTNGFYSAGDGGGASFVVKSLGDDNGVTVIPTSNGLYCHMINQHSYTFDPLLVDSAGEFVEPVSSGGSIVKQNNLATDLSIKPLLIKTRAHKGLSSFAMEMPDESFVVLTREAGVHFDDPLGLIRCYRTEHGSRDMAWGFQSTAQNIVEVDDRDATAGYMANGRIGLMASNNSQFSYSDDNGATWTTAPTGLSTTIGFVDKIHPYPAGGSQAFIAFGTDYSDPIGETRMTAIKTLDNGATWATQTLITGLTESTSEWSVARIGNNNCWIATARQNGDGRPPVYFKSTDMINWNRIGNSSLAMGANPSNILYHEGFLYQFVTFRNRAWKAIQANQAYKGKVVWSRTPAWRVINGDVSDLDDVHTLISLDSALGYFRFMRSPVTGRVHATVATRELYTLVGGNEVRDGFPMSSDLLLLTNEKLATSQTLPDNFIAPSGTGSQLWRVAYDRAGNFMTAFTTVTLNGNGTNIVDLPVSLPKGFSLSTTDDYSVSLDATEVSLSTTEPPKYVNGRLKTTSGFSIRAHFYSTQQIGNFIKVDVTIKAFGYYPRIV